jgi:hypothetical protein
MVKKLAFKKTFLQWITEKNIVKLVKHKFCACVVFVCECASDENNAKTPKSEPDNI